MITDILPDEFYLALGRALAERGEGCIQFSQSGAGESLLGIEADFIFLEKLAAESGRPLLYNSVEILMPIRSRTSRSSNGSPRRTTAVGACLAKR